MDNQELAVFVEAVENYFPTVTGVSANVSSPYLINDINEHLSDYTGIISISGIQKGSVFFTTSVQMAQALMTSMGIREYDDAKQMDIVGEVCNTISGNARKVFGDKFMINVPIILKGKSEHIRISKINDIYLIPVNWRGFVANLIINLNQD